jgi:predicted nucleic acid-binding protein
LNYLIDTNVVSELRKGKRCNKNVASWFAPLKAEEVFLSVLTIGELRRGIELIGRRDRPGAASLHRWLRDLIEASEGQILNVDRIIAEEWGRMNSPNPVPVIDGLLAATARIHNLSVATRNTKDIVRTGVPCVNPFLAPPP